MESEKSFQEQVSKMCSNKHMGTLGMNKNPMQSKKNPMSGSQEYSKNMSEYGMNRIQDLPEMGMKSDIISDLMNQSMDESSESNM